MAVNVFEPSLAHALGGILAWWPLLLVVAGVLVLASRPTWLRQLDANVPGVGTAIRRPQRVFAVALMALGVLLLPFTLHLIDERVLGALLLVASGVLLIWRRAR